MRSNRVFKSFVFAAVLIAIAVAMSLTACQPNGSSGGGAQLSSHGAVAATGQDEGPPVVVAQLDISKLSPAPNANEKLISTPGDMHQPIIQAIQSAKISINLVNFHLSDRDVVDALKVAAGKGVPVQILLDQSILGENDTAQKIFDELQATAGVKIIASSPAFTITHQKSLVVDDQTAFITSMNLVTTSGVTRDYGIVTQDKNIITEMDLVFGVDLDNAPSKTKNTPDLSNGMERLLWSPVNSKPKILGLIALAQSTIDIEVENFGDRDVIAALIGKATKQGVKIRTLTPGCVSGNPLSNRNYLNELASGGAGGITNKVMPANVSAAQPYMHAKMIMIDGLTFYLGSENFSFNSLTKARELGLITSDAGMAQTIQMLYEQDWNVAVDPASITKDTCDAATGPYSSNNNNSGSNNGSNNNSDDSSGNDDAVIDDMGSSDVAVMKKIITHHHLNAAAHAPINPAARALNQ